MTAPERRRDTITRANVRDTIADLRRRRLPCDAASVAGEILGRSVVHPRHANRVLQLMRETQGESRE